MKQQFFLTDLDGTLLRSDASLSKYTIDVFTNALESGLIISYATARGFLSSNKAVSAIPWKYPIVLYNGALIYHPVTKSYIEGFGFSNLISNGIIQLGRDMNLIPLLFMLDEQEQECVFHEQLTRIGDLHFYKSRPNDPRFKEVARLACPESHKALVLTYIGEIAELEALKAEITLRYAQDISMHLMKDQYIENHYFLEISHSKANKQHGLELWSQLMHCKPADVTVFGDNLNDLGMFEAAGTRVAVANAHSAITARADFIVESNDKEGVAKYIEKCYYS